MNGKCLFSKKHVWACIDGDIATVGISSHAQEELGNIVFLSLPEVGTRLEAGKVFGDVESIKTVSDLFAPMDGEVIQVNEELVEEPERINEAPYESWFLKVRVERLEEGLMEEETYLKYKEEQ